jgi:hypothetical protein
MLMEPIRLFIIPLSQITQSAGEPNNSQIYNVSDEVWSFVAPYLTLVTEEGPQRDYDPREAFNDLRWIVQREPHGE